jgi:hypothetical protein
MSRVSFHESLEQIEMNLLSMGELAGTSVQRSVEALVQHDAPGMMATMMTTRSMSLP